MSRKGFLARLVSLLALAGAILAGAAAYGQQSAAETDQAAETDASAANTNSLEEVVVTGTATAAAV